MGDGHARTWGVRRHKPSTDVPYRNCRCNIGDDGQFIWAFVITWKAGNRPQDANRGCGFSIFGWEKNWWLKICFSTTAASIVMKLCSVRNWSMGYKIIIVVLVEKACNGDFR